MCVLSSCRLAPEATVLLIAGMDELHSQGSLPLRLHMKAGWFSSKPPLTFLSWGCCRRDAAALMQQVRDSYLFFCFHFFSLSTSLNFIQLNPSLQTVLLDLILTQTCFIFPKPLRHLLRRVPRENVAEDGSSRKRRQTHEKEDPASSIMRFLWVCLCPRGEEGSAAAVWIWKSKHTLYEHRWCSKDYQALTLSSGVGGWKPLSFTAILIQQRWLAGHYCLSITCILNNASLRLSLLRGAEMFCLQLRAARVLTVFAITVNYVFVILKKTNNVWFKLLIIKRCGEINCFS